MPHSSKVSSVCIVSQLFAPDNQAISLRMKYLYESLMAHEIDTMVLTSKKSKNVSGYITSTLLMPIGTNKDQVIVRLLKELIFGTEMFFRVLLNRSDVYFITSPPFTVALAAVCACALKNKPFVFDVRDEYPEVYFSEGLISSESFIGKTLKRIEAWIYGKSAVTTTVTNRIVKKLIHKIGENDDKIKLLRNGYADNITIQTNPKDKPFVILFHGNMGKFQKPELICDVAEMCAKNNLDVQFRIYGWGNQSQVILDREKIISNLKHMGELDHKEMPNVISKASLGISFQGGSDISRNSFPSKVMEFIGSGIPVIVTPVSEAGDFVVEKKVGYQFEPDQVYEIYLKIKELVENGAQMDILTKQTVTVRNSLSRRSLSDRFVEDVFLKKFS
ncbi:glycosyltransferase family 4 protein [Salibacteraceae bacterium]|nr:glycosyltransferase family 4 protein [Salibacteraceae bacterium]